MAYSPLSLFRRLRTFPSVWIISPISRLPLALTPFSWLRTVLQHKQNKKTDTAQFLDNIFSIHGLPDDIVSDRGTTFTSGWWTEFLKMLGTKPNLSTAFHPETDGHTERIHQSLELHLRCFCDYLQDDWADLLPMAEFAYNSTHHSTIGMTPFFANYGYHPRMSLTLLSTPAPSAQKRISSIHAAHELAKSSARTAAQQYAYWANKKRLDPPSFAVGEKVSLLRRNIRTSRPSGKSDAKRLGPFEILAKVGPVAFKLRLPPTMKIHPTFHVSRNIGPTLSNRVLRSRPLHQ